MTRPSGSLAFLMIAVLLWTAVPAGALLAQSVMAIRPIRGSKIIGPDDVEVAQDMDVVGAIRELDEVVGREAKVTLYPGRPILRGQVGAPAIVERNAVVKMLYSAGPLSIVTDGRVLDRGGVGETVRVMNLSSRQIVSGSVAPDGTIKVSQ